jgi:hypothetical protein
MVEEPPGELGDIIKGGTVGVTEEGIEDVFRAEGVSEGLGEELGAIWEDTGEDVFCVKRGGSRPVDMVEMAGCVGESRGECVELQDIKKLTDGSEIGG